MTTPEPTRPALDLASVKAELDRDESIRTHWDECYLSPRHRVCLIWRLIAEVERLLEANAALKDELENALDNRSNLYEPQHPDVGVNIFTHRKAEPDATD